MGQTYQSIVINALADTGWDAIKDFHDLSWAPNVIEKVEVVGGAGGGDVGAKRVLNDAFHETLLGIDEDGKTFNYSIDDGPPPLTKDSNLEYVGVVMVSPITEGEGCFVEWSSSWDTADDAVHDFVNPIYVALLGDMKKSLSA